MDFELIVENLPYFFSGLLVTLRLTFISLAIGLLMAVPLAVIRNSKNFLLTAPIRAFVFFFRGTPLLVQIYIIYYGLGQFLFIKDTILWFFLKDATFCALLAFTLNTAAYTTEIIRGAIAGTPYGEIEAAKSIGMSRFMMMRRIILPSAFRRALPTYSNEVIFMLHGSSLASVITLEDITGAARVINSKYYSPYEAFLTAAVFYLAITFTLVWLFKKLEHRWYAHLRPREETAAATV